MTVKAETSLLVTRVIETDRETLYRAWTDPDELREWSCPEGSTIEDVRVDLRIGGAYRIRIKGPEGQIHTAVGVYREIEPARKLVYTWDWEEPENEMGETLVTVELRDRGGSTEVVIRHERFPEAEARDLHEEGWTSCLNRLEGRFDVRRGESQ